ncbi:NYN domain-containing protein [Sphingomonas gilva]|uniref:NYN domain-containing protein n=1 Tax=Sphingomonas gilva TaxID=2305907 RepID=A0A396RMX7_9SPHN|nr:NYN domain-containing protein [Sphingomonas gilva]RHW16512.1 NYN domain-containing protein [Sphingomonas gilva]
MTNNDHPPLGNVALLIDADNASPASLDPVLTVLAELGQVNVRRAYGNWSKTGLKTWAALTLKHGIEPQQQFDITKGKNATDMKMTVDAMDLLFRGRVTGFGIMSSDSDFMPLVMRVRQEGLPVYGFGSARTPEGFRQACTRFIDVSGLVAQADDGPPAPRPARRNSASTTATPEPEPAAPEASSVDDDLVKLFGDAWKAAKRDANGFASLSEVGRIAGNRSSFDVRSYGFAKLSDLIATLPEFRAEDRDGRMFVKRVR